MKVGAIDIPEFLTTDDGRIIRSADLVGEIRQEFRDLEESISFHHMLNWFAGRKVLWIIRRKHHYRYVGQRQFAALSLVYFNYCMSGNPLFKVNELYGVQGAFITEQSIRKYLHYCLRSRFVERISPQEWVITEEGIAVARLISKEYQKIVTKNRELLWKAYSLELELE